MRKVLLHKHILSLCLCGARQNRILAQWMDALSCLSLLVREIIFLLCSAPYILGHPSIERHENQYADQNGLDEQSGNRVKNYPVDMQSRRFKTVHRASDQKIVYLPRSKRIISEFYFSTVKPAVLIGIRV